jgi:hypothetical protein
MWRPCRFSAAKDLDWAFLIWFAQCGRVWFTHAMPRPCHTRKMPLWKRLFKATAQCGMDMAIAWHGHGMGMAWAWYGHGMGMAWEWHGNCICELASAILRRHVGDLLAFGFFRLPRGVPRRLYQKHTNPLKCRASSSDISGYHVDFHEGHGTVGEWQGRGMVCVN